MISNNASRDPRAANSHSAPGWNGRLIAFCLTVPALFALATVLLDVPVGHGGFETEKYSKISYDWLANGLFAVDPGSQFNTTRLPVYPALLAIIFALFGDENFTAVLVVQTTLAAATIYVTALTAREFRVSWLWPAAILAALTLNIGYRGTIALPDNLFTLLTAFFMYAALKANTSRNRVTWLFLLGFGGAMAILTRPVFQFAALTTLPVLAVALWARSTKGARSRAMALALVPVAIMATAYGGQVLKIRLLTGHATFTTQTGQHLLTWVVPCLVQPLGCGNRNLTALSDAKERLSKRLARLSPSKRDNPAVVDRNQRALAREMLTETGKLRLAVAALAAYAKIMFHSVVYEIYERLDVQALHVSQVSGSSAYQKFTGFLSAILGSAPMLAWLVTQIAVGLSRCFEIAGVLSGCMTREQRWKFLLVTAMAAGLLAPTLGIGNPRYRAPAEPMLVILLLQGLAATRLLRVRRSNDAGATGPRATR